MTAFYIISIVVCIGFAVVFYMSANRSIRGANRKKKRKRAWHIFRFFHGLVHEIAFIVSPDHDELVNGRRS
jgi:hypothetical protein